MMMTGSCPFVWDAKTDEQTHLFMKDEASESYFCFPPISQPQISHHLGYQKPSTSGSFGDPDPAVAKKLSHSARERHRRKNINSLYSSLRSLLPTADQRKTLSNPSTISRALSYIPELQSQMEELRKKKDELLLSMAAQKNKEEEKKIKSEAWRKFDISSAVSANKLNEREVSIQLCLDRFQKNHLSEILLVLEEDGLYLLNASSFESQNGNAFFNLHLQVESNYRPGDEIGIEGLIFQERREELFEISLPPSL